MRLKKLKGSFGGANLKGNKTWIKTICIIEKNWWDMYAKLSLNQINKNTTEFCFEDVSIIGMRPNCVLWPGKERGNDQSPSVSNDVQSYISLIFHKLPNVRATTKNWELPDNITFLRTFCYCSQICYQRNILVKSWVDWFQLCNESSVIFLVFWKLCQHCQQAGIMILCRLTIRELIRENNPAYPLCFLLKCFKQIWGRFSSFNQEKRRIWQTNVFLNSGAHFVWGPILCLES